MSDTVVQIIEEIVTVQVGAGDITTVESVAQGPAGPPGSGAVGAYTFPQVTALDTWEFDVPERRNCETYDSTGRRLFGAITWDSPTHVRIEFAGAVSGLMVLS